MSVCDTQLFVALLARPPSYTLAVYFSPLIIPCRLTPLCTHTPVPPALLLTLLSLLHPACEFINNTVPGLGMSSRGGTISVVNSSPRFLGCTFLGSSSGIAGTVYINGANTTRPLFQDCHFEGSRTRSSGWGGVTVPEGASSGTFRRCTFQGNKAASGGAVDDGGTSTTLFEDCTFSGNSAEYGGAYYGCKVITSCPHVKNRDRIKRMQ